MTRTNSLDSEEFDRMMQEVIETTNRLTSENDKPREMFAVLTKVAAILAVKNGCPENVYFESTKAAWEGANSAMLIAQKQFN